MRVLLVLGVIGHLLRLFSVAFIAPILLAVFDSNYEVALHFVVALLSTLLAGQVFVQGYRPVRLFRRAEAMGVVAGIWLVIGHFAALPYIFAGLSPVDALFESISGFTTTGATILRSFSLGDSPDGPTLTRAFFLWPAALHCRQQEVGVHLWSCARDPGAVTREQSAFRGGADDSPSVLERNCDGC